jgi:hypothetical protein
MIFVYVKCGYIGYALKLFDHMSHSEPCVCVCFIFVLPSLRSKATIAMKSLFCWPFLSYFLCIYLGNGGK